MRVIVCGGRNFEGVGQVFRALDEFHEKDRIVALMHGGATGVDDFARRWAHANGIRTWTRRADWEKHGRAAGPIRNARMLEWLPDCVIAFPGGRGTADMVQQARKAP